jgi:mycothiol synthase
MRRRAFGGRHDIRAMVDLASSAFDVTLHVVDLPYRLCSWALDEPANVALWEDEGRIVGWAALQTPFWAIDMAVRPEVENALFPRILEWADARAAAARGTPYERPSWYVHVFSDQVLRRRRLEASGFACQADVGPDSWSRVLLRRMAPASRPAPCPPGFLIRPLADREEVEAYVELHRAAFESKNMTREWRTRTLAVAHHVREMDLVAQAPDGQLAGFCIGWLALGTKPVGQIEPFGIGREFRERGLGAALLSECIRRLAAAGAEEILVETDTYRTPALGLYESLGFETARDVLIYRKDSTT